MDDPRREAGWSPSDVPSGPSAAADAIVSSRTAIAPETGPRVEDAAGAGLAAATAAGRGAAWAAVRGAEWRPTASATVKIRSPTASAAMSATTATTPAVHSRSGLAGLRLGRPGQPGQPGRSAWPALAAWPAGRLPSACRSRSCSPRLPPLAPPCQVQPGPRLAARPPRLPFAGKTSIRSDVVNVAAARLRVTRLRRKRAGLCGCGDRQDVNCKRSRRAPHSS